MPFLTEELWHAVYDSNSPAKSIALTRYPVGNTEFLDSPERFRTGLEMKYLTDLISRIRFERKEGKILEKAEVSITLHALPDVRGVFEQNSEAIRRLARVSGIDFSEVPLPEPCYRYIAGGKRFEMLLDFGDFEKPIDVPAERDRLTKDIAKYEKGLAAAERQLGNEGFLAKAPEHIVEGLKKQESETRALLEKARAALKSLPEH
jgi:valyl-tRNA synthetase